MVRRCSPACKEASQYIHRQLPSCCGRGRSRDQETRRPARRLTPVLVILQVKKGTQLGKEMESIMKEGKLVPTEVTVKLLRKAMQASSNDKFLIDGFPRAIDQAETFERDVKPPAELWPRSAPATTIVRNACWPP